MDHLLIGCTFSKELWIRLLSLLGWRHLTVGMSSSFLDWWMLARKRIQKQLRQGFDALVLLLAWELWKERNARVFEGKASLQDVVFNKVLDMGKQWSLAGFDALLHLPSWPDSRSASSPNSHRSQIVTV